MLSLRGSLYCGLISLVFAGYSVNEHLTNTFFENKQRIQATYDETCYTQISDTDYYIETIRVGPKETIGEICRRGDQAAAIIMKYASKKRLPVMNNDKTDDSDDLMIISTADFLDYFKPKPKL